MSFIQIASGNPLAWQTVVTDVFWTELDTVVAASLVVATVVCGIVVAASPVVTPDVVSNIVPDSLDVTTTDVLPDAVDTSLVGDTTDVVLVLCENPECDSVVCSSMDVVVWTFGCFPVDVVNVALPGDVVAVLVMIAENTSIVEDTVEFPQGSPWQVLLLHSSEMLKQSNVSSSHIDDSMEEQAVHLDERVAQ